MSPSNLTPLKPAAKKILVGLTGSIACYKTAILLSNLKKAGHEVQTVATPSALKFIGEATLEGLTGQQVQTDTFATGQMMDHIYLARWADVFVVAPMTAHHLNKFALGLADDLITTLYLAYEKDKPLYLAPAMNSVMYAHETVQNSLKVLKARGAQIIEPGEGQLACGETGAGRMAEPEDIFQRILPEASLKDAVLISFGGTRELIDGVRSITNTSTGETGAKLADAFSRRGFRVTALCAQTSVRPGAVNHLQTFTDHQDLNSKITALLNQNEYAAVIHLAAVSDYSVEKIISNGIAIEPTSTVKISSEHPLTLKLKPNFKIVNELRTYSKNKAIQVIAFKLTNTLDATSREAAVQKLLHSKDVDWVVHNDFHDIDKPNGHHSFQIYGSGVFRGASDVNQLATELTSIIESNKKTSPILSRRFEVNNDLMS